MRVLSNVYRFYGTVVDNPYSSGRENSLLVINVRYKKDNIALPRDHYWIKHRKHKKNTSMFYNISIGVVEFSAKLCEYTDKNGDTKIGLCCIKSIANI